MSSCAAGWRKAVWTTSLAIAPDVDDLADEEALGVGRADAAAELDAGGHDLVADGDRLAGVDLAHDQDAAELADDLAGRGVRRSAGR